MTGGATPSADGMRGPRPCNLRPPHGLLRARPYACGWRCDRHTPAALAEQAADAAEAYDAHHIH